MFECMLHEYYDWSYHDYHYLRFTAAAATAPTELATATAIATAIASCRLRLSSLQLHKLRLAEA